MEVTSSLHSFFISSDFYCYVCSIFDVTQCTPAQTALAIELATSVYWEFFELLIVVVNQSRQEVAIDFDVDQVSGVGKSKIRHVGGWVVRKVLNCARKYIQKNVYTNSSATLALVEEKQRMCELLEETIIQPYAKLEESTKYKEMLEVTEGRHYWERGLLHFSNEAYLFFLELEKKRVKLLNLQVLNQEWENMVETAFTTLRGDEELKASWLSCFEGVDITR